MKNIISPNGLKLKNTSEYTGRIGFYMNFMIFRELKMVTETTLFEQ